MIANTANRPATDAGPARIPVRLLHTDTDAADEPRISEIVVQGWQVAPGLAVNTTLWDGEPLTGSYSLTHLPSGLAVAKRLCARHVDEAATAAIATGIDWTHDAEQILTDPRTAPLRPGVTAWDWCGYDGICVAETYPRPDSRLYDPTSR